MKPFIILIEGVNGSGKSYLSNQLKKIFDHKETPCYQFHCPKSSRSWNVKKSTNEQTDNIEEYLNALSDIENQISGIKITNEKIPIVILDRSPFISGIVYQCFTDLSEMIITHYHPSNLLAYGDIVKSIQHCINTQSYEKLISQRHKYTTANPNVVIYCDPDIEVAAFHRNTITKNRLCILKKRYRYVMDNLHLLLQNESLDDRILEYSGHDESEEFNDIIGKIKAKYQEFIK